MGERMVTQDLSVIVVVRIVTITENGNNMKTKGGI